MATGTKAVIAKRLYEALHNFTVPSANATAQPSAVQSSGSNDPPSVTTPTQANEGIVQQLLQLLTSHQAATATSQPLTSLLLPSTSSSLASSRTTSSVSIGNHRIDCSGACLCVKRADFVVTITASNSTAIPILNTDTNDHNASC